MAKAKEDAKEETTDVAVVQSTEVADYAGYEEDSGAGLEDIDPDELLIPYISLLQGLSPEVKEDGVPNARPGMIYNPANNELFSGKDGITFIPCYREHKFVEWQPRKLGGGFVDVWEAGDDIVLHAKDVSTDYGKFFHGENLLVETYYLYGLALDADGMPTRCVISFASTKIKQYKQLISLATNVMIQIPGGRKVNPPLWAHRFRLRTVETKNDEGDFFIFNIGWDGEKASDCRYAPADDMYKFAKKFKESAETGEAKANYDSSGGKPAGSDGGASDEAEIPF